MRSRESRESRERSHASRAACMTISKHRHVLGRLLSPSSQRGRRGPFCLIDKDLTPGICAPPEPALEDRACEGSPS